jgi:hypothetical protein
MNRQDIICKVMTKLAMLGDPSDPVDDNLKNRLLKQFWNEKNPEKIGNDLKDLVVKQELSKQSVQNLFKFFKLKGLFKRTLPIQGMERMWRTILKENQLQGFLLEN